MKQTLRTGSSTVWILICYLFGTYALNKKGTVKETYMLSWCKLNRDTNLQGNIKLCSKYFETNQIPDPLGLKCICLQLYLSKMKNRPMFKTK